MTLRHFPGLLACLLACLLVLTACSSLQTNPTVFPYRMDDARLKARPIKTVMIAPFSLGGPATNWLEAGRPQVAGQLADYFEAHGHTVLPNNSLSNAWNNAVRFYGNPWDPITGKANRETLAKCLQAALQAAGQATAVDAIVVMDLIERQVLFDPSTSPPRARWDGVSRKPTLVGPDNYVTADFNWDRPVGAFSIAINVYNSDFELLFQSVGGIDLSQDINTRTGSIGYTRREQPFRYRSPINEGIALALHPLIPMKHYPAPRKAP